MSTRKTRAAAVACFLVAVVSLSGSACTPAGAGPPPTTPSLKDCQVAKNDCPAGFRCIPLECVVAPCTDGACYDIHGGAP